MIPEHMEPSGLAPDAKPIADFYSEAERRSDALNGSNALMEAILRASGVRRVPAADPTPIPIRKSRVRRGRPLGSVKRRSVYRKVFRIQAEVAKRFGISAIEISSGPTRANSEARHLAMFLARHLTDASYPDLARHFNRDHTTVIHGVRTVQAKLDSRDAMTVGDINAIMGALRA